MAQKKLTRQVDQKHNFNFVWPSTRMELIHILYMHSCFSNTNDNYGTGHMQRRTRRQAPASIRLKWVSHRATLLVHVLTRACVLLSYACALAHRVVKNLLKHHKSFTIQGYCRNLGLIPPAVPIYQIRNVMRFYGWALKFTGKNE